MNREKKRGSRGGDAPLNLAAGCRFRQDASGAPLLRSAILAEFAACVKRIPSAYKNHSLDMPAPPGIVFALRSSPPSGKSNWRHRVSRHTGALEPMHTTLGG